MNIGGVCFLRRECVRLIRAPRSWFFVVTLPAFVCAVAWALRAEFRYGVFAFYLMAVYVVPPAIYGRQWLKFNRSSLGEASRLTLLSRRDLVAGYFMPRAGMTFLALLVSFIPLHAFFGLLQRYGAVSAGSGVLIFPESIGIMLWDDDAIWADWRFHKAAWFVFVYLYYNTAAAGILFSSSKGMLQIMGRYFVWTLFIDAFACFLSFRADDGMVGAIVHLRVYPSDPAGLMQWVVAHASRNWLPWWYATAKLVAVAIMFRHMGSSTGHIRV